MRLVGRHDEVWMRPRSVLRAKDALSILPRHGGTARQQVSFPRKLRILSAYSLLSADDGAESRQAMKRPLPRTLTATNRMIANSKTLPPQNAQVTRGPA